MLQYKKAIAAGIAWVGTLCVALTDLSLSTEEISALIVGALGVYAVYKSRNEVV